MPTMYTKVKIDPCRDANGFYTIRYDDGSENGDTESQPIATAYTYATASLIVSAFNNSGLVPFLQDQG